MKTNKIFFIVLISLFFITTSCTDKVQKEYDIAIEKADKMFKEGDYQRATSFYNQALKLMPKEAHAKDKLMEIKEILATEKEVKFQELVEKANAFFEQGEYDAARTAYLRALKIKPNTVDLQDKIAAIDSLQSDAAGLNTDNTADATNPYHIIVGSFQREDNAVNLQQELVNKGFNSKIFQRPDGYTAVSITSFATIHEAYNNLEVNVDGFVDAWVIRNSQ